MTEASYPALPFKAYLDALFKRLQQPPTNFNPDKACAVLDKALERMLKNGRAEVIPALPRGWRLEPQGEDLDIVTDPTYNPALAAIRIHDGAGGAAPMPWHPEWQMIREVVLRASHDIAATVAKSASVPALMPGIVANDDMPAFAWLVDEFKTHREAVKRDKAKGYCKEHFNTSGLAFRALWRMARVQAGLPAKAPSGPKKKSKKKSPGNSVTE